MIASDPKFPVLIFGISISELNLMLTAGRALLFEFLVERERRALRWSAWH